MDYKKLSDAIRLCGSTPKIHECKEKCQYYAGGNMTKCIPVMTKDAANVIRIVNDIQENAYMNEKQLRESYIDLYKKLKQTEKERDKSVEMIRTIAHQFGTCDGCKHLGSKCSVPDYWCEKDGKDHWEWEGL